MINYTKQYGKRVAERQFCEWRKQEERLKLLFKYKDYILPDLGGRFRFMKRHTYKNHSRTKNSGL